MDLTAQEFPRSINRASPRPTTYGECLTRGLGTKDTPCPYVSCKHHLYLDVEPATGSLHVNWPDTDPTELEETCSLHVAETTKVTLDQVGLLLGVTRERIRQIEALAIKRVRKQKKFTRQLDDHRKTTIVEPWNWRASAGGEF